MLRIPGHGDVGFTPGNFNFSAIVLLFHNLALSDLFPPSGQRGPVLRLSGLFASWH